MVDTGETMEDDMNDEKPNLEKRESLWKLRLREKKTKLEEEGDDSYRKKCCAIVTAILLTFFMAIGYLTLFSRMDIQLIADNPVGSFIGYGSEVFVILTENADYAYYTGAFAVIGLVVLYVLDVQNWQGFLLKLIGRSLVVVFVCALLVTCLLFSESFPSAPFGVYFAISSLIHLIVSRTFFAPHSTIQFLKGTSIGLLITSLAVLGIWVYWIVGEENSWKTPLKLEFYTALECPVSFQNYTNIQDLANANISIIEAFFESDESSQSCELAFFLWVSPFIYFACTFAFAWVLFFVYRAQLEILRNEQAARVDPVAQVFMGLITLSIMGMWVAASIASATSSVSSSILAFSLLAFVASVGVSFGVFGVDYMRSQLIKTPLGKAAFEFAKGDWGKGFVVVTLTPIILLFLLLNILTQFIRKFTFLGKNLKDEEEKRGLFTGPVGKFVKNMQTWDWGSIYIKSLYWGIFFFVVVVGVARITTVFLSWLKQELVVLELSTTIIIFIAVGIFMFLLPPVPGVPVYIAGGIIITDKTEEQFGFLGGLLFTLAICFGLKMLAITMQQKLIGELFGSKSVYIRSLVQVNSDTLKAMRIILAKPGIHIDKVVILIGGPDWPTSVLTGIMRLPLFQMLLGSVPVVFLIAPCVVSGAMLVKAAEGGIYTSLNTVSITLTFVIQSGSMLAAMHFLAKKVAENKEEIDKMPNDPEVEERNERTRRKVELLRDWSHWRNLNILIRWGHRISTLLMIASCYAFQLLGKSIFVTFNIEDSIETTLDGNVFNLLKTPFAYYPLGAFGFSVLYLTIFSIIRGRRVARLYKLETRGTSFVSDLEI